MAGGRGNGGERGGGGDVCEGFGVNDGDHELSDGGGEGGEHHVHSERINDSAELQGGGEGRGAEQRAVDGGDQLVHASPVLCGVSDVDCVGGDVCWVRGAREREWVRGLACEQHGGSLRVVRGELCGNGGELPGFCFFVSSSSIVNANATASIELTEIVNANATTAIEFNEIGS